MHPNVVIVKFPRYIDQENIMFNIKFGRSLIPEFQIANIHVKLQQCNRNDEERLLVSHTVAKDICNALSVLAPNLHVMPAQIRGNKNIFNNKTIYLLKVT